MMPNASFARGSFLKTNRESSGSSGSSVSTGVTKTAGAEDLNLICDLCKIQPKGFEVLMIVNNKLFYQSSNVSYQILCNILLKSSQSHGTQHKISYL
jgi:hypothetical protein